MKLVGKCVTGDPIHVNSYTSDWLSVRLHPLTFYRRLEEIQNGFDKVKGLYTELDLGQYVLIRFSDKADLTEFHRLHHTYI